MLGGVAGAVEVGLVAALLARTGARGLIVEEEDEADLEGAFGVYLSMYQSEVP